MITKEQIESLDFVYKQELFNKNKDFVNGKLKTMISLSTDGKVDIIFNNYKKKWSNIESISRVIELIQEIENTL